MIPDEKSELHEFNLDVNLAHAIRGHMEDQAFAPLPPAATLFPESPPDVFKSRSILTYLRLGHVLAATYGAIVTAIVPQLAPPTFNATQNPLPPQPQFPGVEYII